MKPAHLLLRLLRDPSLAARLTAAQWDLLVRQARAANLLGRLADQLGHAPHARHVPGAVHAHFRSALRLCEAQHQAVRHEVANVRDATHPLGIPVVLLKGAAYVMGDSPAARGRSFSDLDILVPRARLDDVESALMLAGWVSAIDDAYDQRYYRRWMHEIPPMLHMKRGTGIDVHHALTPLTARWRADSDAMLADAVDVPDCPGVKMLQPMDQILHSATHLFLESELPNGLRDLSDMDLLLRHHAAADDAFFPRLAARARRVNLQAPLSRALRHAATLFGTPVPREMTATAGGAPDAWIDALYRHAYFGTHHSGRTTATPLALWLLYVRGHWMRMPLPLLAVHLTRKALRREAEAAEAN